MKDNKVLISGIEDLDVTPRSSSKLYPIAALIFSIFFPLANLFAPLLANRLNLEFQLEVNKQNELLKRKVELTNILFGNYFGKEPTQQKIVIRFLATMFPNEFLNTNFNNLLTSSAANDDVVNNITNVVSGLLDNIAKTYDISLEELRMMLNRESAIQSLGDKNSAYLFRELNPKLGKLHK